MAEPDETSQDDLNPKTLLAEALADLRSVDAAVFTGLLSDASMNYARVQAIAAIAQGAALLQPSPEEVIAVYQETSAEVLEEEAQKIATATRILQEAKHDGSRRHPAIHAALEALGDG